MAITSQPFVRFTCLNFWLAALDFLYHYESFKGFYQKMHLWTALDWRVYWYYRSLQLLKLARAVPQTTCDWTPWSVSLIQFCLANSSSLWMVIARNLVFLVKIAEGGRGLWAILTSLIWKNIVKLWFDPLNNLYQHLIERVCDSKHIVGLLVSNLSSSRL